MWVIDRVHRHTTVRRADTESLVGQEFEIWDDSVTIGREDCVITIADKPVSRTHARISLGSARPSSGETEDELAVGGSGFILTDLESKFGTSINKQRVPKGQSMALPNGAIILLGKRTELVFRDLRAGAGSSETRDELAASPDTDDELGAATIDGADSSRR